MTLEQLLRLVPRFHEGLCRTLEGTTMTSAAPVRLMKVDQRVMESYCPNIEAIEFIAMARTKQSARRYLP
jgi:hypothetical protein